MALPLRVWVQGLLKGSWGLVARVMNKVTMLIIDYNPQLGYL